MRSTAESQLAKSPDITQKAPPLNSRRLQSSAEGHLTLAQEGSISSNVGKLEERLNWQAAKLRHATILGERQTLAAQQELDKSLITSIMAKLALSDCLTLRKDLKAP